MRRRTAGVSRGVIAFLLFSASMASALTLADLRRFVHKQLDSHPGWAKSYRDGDGPGAAARADQRGSQSFHRSMPSVASWKSAKGTPLVMK